MTKGGDFMERLRKKQSGNAVRESVISTMNGMTESEVRNMLLWYLMEEIENDW